MRLHRVLPLVTLGLLGLPFPAHLAPTAVPVPLPHAGEIRLDGLVTDARLTPKNLRMTVTTVTSASGTITALTVPRPKTILFSAVTRVTAPGLAAKGLSDVRVGDVVSVIGDDSGPGKPLAARSVFVLLAR